MELRSCSKPSVVLMTDSFSTSTTRSQNWDMTVLKDIVFILELID